MENYNKMRTNKELLQIMLDHINILSTGLCHLSNDLILDNIINYDEYKFLRNYIKLNRPNKFSSLKVFRNRNNPFYWFQGDKTPRIKWLKKHIKLNS